jgi:hypothetical protein
MINHSVAYDTFKRSMAQQLDFVVLVSHAVPVLQRVIDSGSSGTFAVPLEPPDFFTQRRLSAAQLTEFAAEYEHDLSRTLIITSFSYFEAYIKALIKEFVAFHGGVDRFRSTASRRATRSLTGLGPTASVAKRKLQEPPDHRKIAKYAVYSSKLASAGFRFPSELFAVYGVERLLEKIGKDKRRELKAGEIPALLIDAFHMTSFAKHVDAFEDLRKLRNEIAHGKRQRVAIKSAIAAGRELRAAATAVDSHFVNHFFILEQYAP